MMEEKSKPEPRTPMAFRLRRSDVELIKKRAAKLGLSNTEFVALACRAYGGGK